MRNKIIEKYSEMLIRINLYLFKFNLKIIEADLV